MSTVSPFPSSVASPAGNTTPGISSPALRVEGLERRFGPVQALSGLTFAVHPGEIYGLVGPDGAGKTTAIRLLAGLMLPDRGIVRVLGHDPASSSNEVRESLGLMPQQYSLYGDLSVAENLRFFGQLFCLPRRVFQARSERLLAITRLAPFTGRRADSLSGGMYKKLALACALLHEPRALLLDEPTNGVDPVSRRELWALLHEFVAEGMAILISTPYMDEAERCHRVGLIHRGALVAEGPPRALVQAFDHEVVEIEGGARHEVEAVVEASIEVRASSPAGERLRLVLAPGASATLAARLEPLGARLRPAMPDFEDLFLIRTRREDV